MPNLPRTTVAGECKIAACKETSSPPVVIYYNKYEVSRI